MNEQRHFELLFGTRVRKPLPPLCQQSLFSRHPLRHTGAERGLRLAHLPVSRGMASKGQALKGL
eukprot:1612253-Alexandrium_andersonii.AAC.1